MAATRASLASPGEAELADRLRAWLLRAPWHGSASDLETLPPPVLVDVRRIACSLVELPAPPWCAPHHRFLVRPEVAERLAAAAAHLPENLRLGFWEGYRPLRAQRLLWENGLTFMRSVHPGLPAAALEPLLEQLVAPPCCTRTGAAPPHSTGSAVDVAPVDAFGRVLTPDEPWGRFGIQVLAEALRAAGLASYAPEWWHWSYGDAEWARAHDCAPLPFAAPPADEGPGDGI